MRYFISSVFVLMLAVIVGSVDTSANIPPSPPIAQPVMPVLAVKLPVITIPTETFSIEQINYAIDEIQCLSMNIYFEGRNQSITAQKWIAYTTLNRVKSDKFPNTICKAVWQHRQFSWTQDGKSDRPKNKKAFAFASKVAFDVLRTYKTSRDDISNGSLWYHATYVKPEWRTKFIKVATIQEHIFYKPR